MYPQTDHRAMAGAQIRDESIARLHEIAGVQTWTGDIALAAELTEIASELELAASMIGGAR